jgi:hypothetical protein
MVQRKNMKCLTAGALPTLVKSYAKVCHWLPWPVLCKYDVGLAVARQGIFWQQVAAQ